MDSMLVLGRNITCGPLIGATWLKFPDMTRLISSHTTPQLRGISEPPDQTWTVWPSKSFRVPAEQHKLPALWLRDRDYRKRGCVIEITANVLNACHNKTGNMTERHNGVLARLVKSVLKDEHTSSINRILGDSCLRPDLVMTYTFLIWLSGQHWSGHGANCFSSWALSSHGSRPTDIPWTS